MATAPLSNASLALQPLPRPDRSFYYSRVKTREAVIKSYRRLNYDTVEFVVKCDDDGSPPIVGQAGQYATLRTPEITTPRAFSFARTPEDENRNEHTFLVRLVHGGRFSGWLFEKDQTGAPITISGPLGSFTLDSSDKDILCVAGGSGMSGIKALLEHAANMKVERNCLFLYGARQQRDLYYNEELAQIQRNWHPDYKFEFVQVLSEEPEQSSWPNRGLVTDFLKANYVDQGKLDLRNAKAYLCGPPPMIDAACDLLWQAGMPHDDVRFDKFEDSTAPAPVIDNTKCVLCDECLYAKPVENCIVEVSKLRRQASNGGGDYDLIQPADTAGIYYSSLYIDAKECIRCFSCVEVCPVGAISVSNDKNVNSLRRLFE
jgi:NAD(P)H-flavin reductase